MSVIRPDVLALLPVALLLAIGSVLWRWRRTRRLVEAYGGPDAALRLTGRPIGRFPAGRLSCLLGAALSLVVAGAGLEPDRPEPVDPPAPVDLVIAVDVSSSMSGSDVGTSRIARVRDLVGAILEAEAADRVGLLLFADWPFELVPLTHDAGVVEFFAPFIAPELVTLRDQGTGLASAISHASLTWRARRRPAAVPVLLIVTDGEIHGTDDDVLAEVAAVADSGMAVWTAGVGSQTGAPLTVSGSDGTPLLDGAGRPVVAGYRPDLLGEVARRGGGAFHDVSDDGGRDDLLADLRALKGAGASSESPAGDPAIWLVLVGLALLLAEAVLDSGARSRRRDG